jgi:hypothetical protein
MQLARFVRTLGHLLVLGLAGFGGGCGPQSSAPISQEEGSQIKESKKQAHKQVTEDAQRDLRTQTTQRRAAQHRGPGGGE